MKIVPILANHIANIPHILYGQIHVYAIMHPYKYVKAVGFERGALTTY
jgi:hypothetical protein